MRYDVIIAGAGPAGCAAALTLCRAGWSVALVDTPADTRFKIGESLPGAALRLLRALGIPHLGDLLPAAAYAPCYANVSAWGQEQWVYTDAILNPEGGGWHLDRVQFETALRQRVLDAGATFIDAQVTNIEAVKNSPRFQVLIASKRSGDAVKQLESDRLIDATGRRFFIGRKLGGQRIQTNRQVAVSGWFSAAQEPPDHTTKIKSVAEGWWYSSRLPNNVRVVSFHGLPAAVAPLVHRADLFTEYFNQIGMLPIPLAPSQLLAPLRTADAGVSRAVCAGGPGWLAVGDAAFASDPLSSQGMFFALYSGLRAAEIMLKHSPIDCLTAYQRCIDRVFEASQRQRQYFYKTELRFFHNPYWEAMRNIETTPIGHAESLAPDL